MSDINICTFTGRLGADPEIKSFQSGGRIANLRVAVGEQWKKDGQKKERTEWVSLTIQSDGLVGIAERFLRKGSRIAFSGKMQTRKWQDQNGNDRFSTEIVLSPFGGSLTMLDGPSGDAKPREQQSSGGGSGWGQQNNGGFGDDLDDDIPFATSDSIF